jgi:hypothetical protein
MKARNGLKGLARRAGGGAKRAGSKTGSYARRVKKKIER